LRQHATRTGLTGIVIGGGQSSRMRTPKPMIHLGGKLIIARIVDVLRPLCDELIFVVRDEQDDYAPDTAIALRMHVVTDTHPYEGPLAAIHAGLTATVTPLAFVTGADYPFLSRTLIQSMVTAAWGTGSSPESVAARVDGRVHPLHSVLAPGDWTQVMGDALAAGERSPSRVINSAIADGGPPLNIMTEDEIQQFDPRLLSFFDIDTPEQLSIARRIVDPRRILLRPDIRKHGL
jgi:molybdopterin-guanine dinucleotide biosynthesis protein A